MVINSTNINKTNNHLSEALTLTELTEYKKDNDKYMYDVENPDPGLGQAQKCGG